LPFNFPSPGHAFSSPTLDEPLKAGQIDLDAERHGSDRPTNVPHDPFGFIVHLQHDFACLIGEAVKRNHAGIFGSLRAFPGNPFVGPLLGDDRIPFFFFAGNLRLPVQVGAVELFDLVHAFYELRKFLKLRPLVVGGTDRDIYLDRFFDQGHTFLFSLVGLDHDVGAIHKVIRFSEKVVGIA
jgi:hypothetical protein